MYNAMYGPGNCASQTLDCATHGSAATCAAADNFCYANVEALLDTIAERDEYDIREFLSDPFPPTYYVDYLNSAPLQTAIGAYVNFSESNAAVGNAFGATGDDDRTDGTVAAMRKLIAAGLTVVQYAGDADYNCNWLGGQAVASAIDAPGFSSAGFVNLSTADGVVHGQVKQAGKYAFVRIYESGHEVPFYQPGAALAMFERAVQGTDVATGRRRVRAGFRTRGPSVSSYREGNATVQFKEVGDDATYNTTTNEPNPGNGSRMEKRGLEGGKRRSKRLFKPVSLAGWI